MYSNQQHQSDGDPDLQVIRTARRPTEMSAGVWIEVEAWMLNAVLFRPCCCFSLVVQLSSCNVQMSMPSERLATILSNVCNSACSIPTVLPCNRAIVHPAFSSFPLSLSSLLPITVSEIRTCDVSQRFIHSDHLPQLDYHICEPTTHMLWPR